MIRLLLVGGLALAPVIAGCSPSNAPVAAPKAARAAAATTAAPVDHAVAAPAATTASSPVVVAQAGLPSVLVHKSPTCGCCAAWVEHLRRSGFTVQVQESNDLEPVKKRLGVPAGKGSCHTAEVGGLVVEGHVPAADIKRLLSARGNARGLVVPGMPMGSPGMESPDGRVQPYTVEKINADGSTSPFATHGK